MFFTHQINNPNNLVIKDTDYYAVPFGHRCTSALACKYADIRKFSLPFDWTIPSFPDKIKKVLENDFDNFIPDVHNNIILNKYGIALVHFNPDIDKGIEEYKRRIARFQKIINEPNKKLYFIYINEDYLYDINYRDDEFNDYNFNSMIEMEHFIKEKYVGLDFTILYFDFKKHDVPINSNIINIVLHTDHLYDKEENSTNWALRVYCGKILAELLKSNLNTILEPDIFYN
jgi:hypothetical protein